MKPSRVVLLSLLIAAVAGAAPVVGALAKTPWSGENPGQGQDHARLPDAALQHNQALADHPSADDNETDDNETGDGDHDDETGDNETGDGDHDDETGDNETGDGDHDNETGGDDHNWTGDHDDNETVQAQFMPLHWMGNQSHNGSIGSGTWNISNGTLTVTAGNFSWHGINCSWESFTWTRGQNLSEVINITCDFRGMFTVRVANGEVNITWSNGSWDHTMGAPMAPDQAQALVLMAFASREMAPESEIPSLTPVTLQLPF